MKEKIKLLIQKVKLWVLAHKKLAVVILIVLVVGGFGARRMFGKDGKPTFMSAQVELTTLINSIQASGSVLSTGQQAVTSKASGVVKQIFVNDGDSVAKGDKLVEFELDREGEEARTKAWSTYLSGKNTLEAAKYNQYSYQADMFGAWDEFKELAESDNYIDDNLINRSLPEFHIPQKDWLAAEAKYKNQAAVVSQAQAAMSSNWLAYQTVSPIVTAPASGVVGDLLIAPGMVVSPMTGENARNTKLLSLVTGEVGLVAITVSEVDVLQIEVGQKATISVDAVADKTFTGKVVGVDRSGTVTQGVVNYQVLVSLDVTGEKILPNMSVTADIILSSVPNVLVVPAGAVSQVQGQDMVMVLVGEKSEPREVEVGLRTATQVEIVSGLKEGEAVVTGQRQADGEATQFGESRMRFGGGALRPGGFGGGSRGGSGFAH